MVGSLCRSLRDPAPGKDLKPRSRWERLNVEVSSAAGWRRYPVYTLDQFPDPAISQQVALSLEFDIRTNELSGRHANHGADHR